MKTRFPMLGRPAALLAAVGLGVMLTPTYGAAQPAAGDPATANPVAATPAPAAAAAPAPVAAEGAATASSDATPPARDGEPPEVVVGDFDVDDPGALATMAFAGGVGKLATTSVRAADSLTAAGLHVAPRYMSQVGDVDVSALGGFVNFPANEGSLLGAQVSLQARVLPGLVAIADMGPISAVGLRGPLWSDDDLTLGWDAHYRSDVYFAAEPGFGLTQAGFGLIPGFPGGSSQGLELALNSEYDWADLHVFATPLAAAMSNRTSVGLVAGADYDLGPFTLGYGATVQSNLMNPGAGIVTIRPIEIKHSLGLRLFLNDWAYLQANYHLMPADTYGVNTQTVLAGIGTRLLGSFSRTEIEVARAPEPAPTPEPTPVPPGQTPAPDYDSLVGRIRHSLTPGGNPGKPLEVGLKVKTARGWAKTPFSARTDASGRYTFHRLPDGEYEVVFRNEKILHDVVGAAVSAPVRVRAWTTPRMDLDVAWNESAIKGRIVKNTIAVEWAPKPGTDPDTMYEVIVKYSPAQPSVSGSTPDSVSNCRFDVSNEIKGRKLFYSVKYWKKGDAFWGANYYGQSNYHVLEVAE